MYIFHTHALCVDEAVENLTVQKQKAHSGDVVDGMETIQCEDVWNESFTPLIDRFWL